MQSKQALPHAPSRGPVARTDALWNKLACPREPTGSLSEAIYSPHTQRLTAGPASRASGWPPNRGPKSLAQPERPAANPAGACDARRLRGGLLGAPLTSTSCRSGRPEAAGSPPARPRRHRRQNRRCSPRRGLRRGQIVEERCHLAAAHEAPRAAAPRAPQPIRLRRAARDAGRRCARLAASCWPSAVRSTLLSSMIEALPSS